MDTSQAQQTATTKRKSVMVAPGSRRADHNLTHALSHEKEILVRVDEETRFSRALTNFLEQQCVKGAELSSSDKQ